jgi:hypothetical protein
VSACGEKDGADRQQQETWSREAGTMGAQEFF